MPEDNPAEETDPDIEQATDDQLRSAMHSIRKDIQEGCRDNWQGAFAIQAIKDELEKRRGISAEEREA